MSFLHPSAHSERDVDDGRRGAIYLPDGLATKLLCVCDAAAGLQSSEPDSPIHSDLEDLWSNVRASSVSPVDSVRAEEDIRRFAERYGLDHCLSHSNLSWLDEVKTSSEDLYKDLLEAAFGNPSGGAAYKYGGSEGSSQIEESFLNYNEASGPAEPSPEITHSSLPLRETPRVYYDRPHTPQIIYVNLSQQKYHDFWEIPDLMKKPSLFPPTPRNIRNWIFWRRVHGRC